MINVYFMINIQENALTDGARALAKHACRSSSGYWGSLVGNGEYFFLKVNLLDTSSAIAFQFYLCYLGFSSIGLFSI
jgi:hypothetical protein